MAGWKEFAFEWRQRPTAYPLATVDHIAIYGDKSQTLYTIDASGAAAHHKMGHLEVTKGSTSWRGTFSYNNEFWGESAGISNTLGAYNTVTGCSSFTSNTIGSYNSVVGYFALRKNIAGNYNVALGYNTLVSSISGNTNTAIGCSALASNISGSGNVALGHQAGYYETGSNKLYIANTAGTSADALIYGDFSTRALSLNANVTVSGTMLSSGPSGGIGYTNGAFGTATQTSSRTTAVEIHKMSGEITLFSAAGSVTPASFTVTNNMVDTKTLVVPNQKSGADKYHLLITNVTNGSFQVTFFTTGGTTTETPVISFMLFRYSTI